MRKEVALILVVCGALTMATIQLLGDNLTSVRVEREYEDGSGVLSDGRTFCIKDELCDEGVK